jgi:low affinity Fe/Cu permease
MPTARQLLCLLDMAERIPDDHSSLVQATKNVNETRSGTGARNLFHRFAHGVASATGSPYAFLIAALIIIVWAVSGRYYNYSDTWQLVINTGTTIVTFLMVFLIQNTQNRDAKALHLKLDELIRAKKGARNSLMDLENCTDEELAEIEREFKRLRARAGERDDREHPGHRPQGERTPAHRA